MNICRHSKNVIKPIEEKMTYKEAKKKIDCADTQPIQKKSFNISIVDYDFKSLYVYEQYNKKRLKSLDNAIINNNVDNVNTKTTVVYNKIHKTIGNSVLQ